MDSEEREALTTILQRLDRIEARLALLDPVGLKRAWAELAAVERHQVNALHKETRDGLGETS